MYPISLYLYVCRATQDGGLVCQLLVFRQRPKLPRGAEDLLGPLPQSRDGWRWLEMAGDGGMGVVRMADSESNRTEGISAGSY